MPGRLPVERWSRPELEDRFHSIADQVQSLKQNNHRLQREMKILNGRIGAGRGGEVRDGPERDEIDELHRSNQVLSQKLKVLKHQLLNYTATNRPRPSTSAARPATAQPTKMPAGTGQSPQRKQPMPSAIGRRPQSAVVGSSRKMVGQRTRAIPASAGAIPEYQSSSRTEPIPVNPVIDESPERTKLEGAQTRSRSGSQNNGWVEIMPERPFQRQFSQEYADIGAADGRLRDLQRQNRKILTENDELRFSLEKSEQKLDTLRREYDRITVELEQTRQELHTQSDSLSSFREEAQRKTESSSKSAEISDRELAILREECRSLKAAHDRLIAKSMEEQNSGKETLEEMARLRVQLEQSSSESQSERQELETLVQRLRSENARLERELRLIEQGQRNREPMEDMEDHDRGNDRIQENNKNVRGDSLTGHKAINGKMIQNPHDRVMQKEAQIAPNPNNEEAVLNKLFTDVLDIVNNHVVGNNAQSVDRNGNKADFTENRWHRMYEDVYEELEKVRRLLLSEHDLNGKLKEQMRLMALENENLKAKYQQNLADLRKELEERGLKMGILERELESVAAAGEMKDLMLGGRKFVAGGKQHGIESTELSLQISKLSMSQLALEQAGSEKPTVFIAVEFFDFELQTSQLVNGPEADFDFTAVFELTVSDLFIHYLQTEGINVELYIVKDGLNYELWSQAKIPLRKLLSAQTPTQFRGELIFSAISNDAEKEQKTPQPVLARLAYTVQVPFSLLRALAAQRRRMAATALIPLGRENVDEDTNELVIQIHRCVGLDKLKSIQDQNGPPLPTTYVAYEFFHFPVHMSKVVAQSGNPMFEDSQTWRLPAGSEAIHKYLLEEDLLIFVIEENSNATESKEAGSLQSRALGHISLPLFPLSQSQKIRGSFPLVDRADESITSGASIDVSIYWKFAYVFEGMNGKEKVRVKRFQPLSNVEAKKTVEDTEEVRKDDTVEAFKGKQEANKQQTESVRNASFSEKDEAVNGAESSEEEEEMDEQELRRRLFQNTVAVKEHSMNGNANNSEAVKEVPKENGDKPKILISNDAVEEKEAEAKNSTSISAPEKIESPKSSSESEDHAQINEIVEDDAESVKSDATYTLEGVPDFEEDEDEAKDEKAAEKEVVIEDEDIRAQTVENVEKNDEKPAVKPEPAVRRSLLGELPPIQPQRPIPQVETESSFESVREASSSKEQQAKKSVEFTDPLHSSIPPSDISSSFAEDALSGESARSSRSNASESSSSSNSRGESSTPTNEEGAKKKEQNEQGKAAFLPRRKPRTRKGRQRKQPDMTAVPTTSAIRIRPKEESVESSLSEHSLASPRDGKSIVMIKVGKLRVLEHSPLLHPEYDSGRVFVEWNFLDIERELCETEGTMQLPRHADEQVDFDQQRAYELNQKRVALLKQWTELNIRLTFTLVLEADEQQGQEPGESDDLCMGELDLMEVLNTNSHTLIMRNVDNMAIAILEVEVDYSVRLMQQIREAIDEAGDDEMIDEV